MSLLKLSGIRGGYSDVDIIHGINLEVNSGEIVTIAGTNGAGKSTLVKALLGLLPRVNGAISLDGRDLSKLAAEDRFYAGLAYVPQVANVFGSLTVRENLQVVRGVKNIHMRMQNVLEAFPALTEKLSQRAGNLSGGERQQLAFARALMPSPKLMVLDEPTAALAPLLVEKVFELVADLPKSGVAVLMVEQRARQALEISDQGYILDQGRCVLSGQAQALLSDSKMTQLYLGNH
ncbi:ABC transporter ATP-binding protein [Orrella sp. NBD-18]|uniref:ABC transporter ATP-binding protein n=1 Tax=Sheuella amnicola TaxID=2707330 RepID=A0A6B2R8M8_9BURK|nr:ABC transporter ATP-binding protein [Sheuella amnicola]NDY83655.1 ABC transporter ATP-binding protein [Sheuella amnicola]HBI82439.1 ABC transporter ATP-binding protein [Alcaligenaceae bacterium]